MEIRIKRLFSGAREAEGLTVVIDVFRAATTCAYLYGREAERVIAVEGVEEALALKLDNPSYVLVGEREGRRLPGFDYGNSPSEIDGADLKGKTVVFTTSSGVQGIIAAKNAEEILLGSFVNAKATAEYILKRNPAKVSLVAMGWAGREDTEEDLLCAEYLRDILAGETTDFPAIKKKLNEADSSGRFFVGDPDAPIGDYEAALRLDRFGFVLKAERKERLIEIKAL